MPELVCDTSALIALRRTLGVFLDAKQRGLIPVIAPLLIEIAIGSSQPFQFDPRLRK